MTERTKALPDVSFKRTYDLHGEPVTIHELARRAGVTVGIIRMRLYKGLSASDPAMLAPRKRPRVHVVRIGDRFGYLTIQAEGPPTSRGRRTMRCACVCGDTRNVKVPDLVGGIITSCGCKYGRNAGVDSWIGRTVGLLTVIGIERKVREARFGPRVALELRCRCFCGNVVVRAPHKLRLASRPTHPWCIMCDQCRETKYGTRNRRSERTHRPRNVRRRRARGANGAAKEAKTSKAQAQQSPRPPMRLFGREVTIAEVAELAGVTRAAVEARLKRGLSVENCLQPSTSRRKTLIGKRFGRLTVQALDVENSGRHRMQRWQCLCDCGRRKSVLQCHLVTGRTRSCGCLHADAARNRR